MLVLARKLNEKIVIGDNIVIQVLRKSRDMVKLGIQAPPEVPVHRQEVYDEIQRSNQGALRRGSRQVPVLSPKTPSPRTAPVNGLPSEPVPQTNLNSL